MRRDIRRGWDCRSVGTSEQPRVATQRAGALAPTPVGDGLVPSRRALRTRFENAHAFSWQPADALRCPRTGDRKGRPYTSFVPGNADIKRRVRSFNTP